MDDPKHWSIYLLALLKYAMPSVIPGLCDRPFIGVLYRPTYFRDEHVYEIVSEPDEVVQ